MRYRFVLLFTSLTLASQGARAEPAPEWVVENWTGLVGTWVADNSAYKTTDAAMDAFGLEWSWGLNQKSLVGRLYGIKDGKEVATFWELREFWHPGKGELLTEQFGGNGAYGVGPHRETGDGSTEMLQVFYDPSTGRENRVGHRAVLDGDEHTTTSFDVDDDGTWTERRTYVWRRQR